MSFNLPPGMSLREIEPPQVCHICSKEIKPDDEIVCDDCNEIVCQDCVSEFNEEVCKKCEDNID